MRIQRQCLSSRASNKVQRIILWIQPLLGTAITTRGDLREIFQNGRCSKSKQCSQLPGNLRWIDTNCWRVEWLRMKAQRVITGMALLRLIRGYYDRRHHPRPRFLQCKTLVSSNSRQAVTFTSRVWSRPATSKRLISQDWVPLSSNSAILCRWLP